MTTEQKFCQSCGMPLADVNDFGTNADGSKNGEYCKYCYENGHFTQQCTMEEMIEHCAQFVSEFNKDSDRKLTREEAIGKMKMFFPHLKRWRKEITITSHDFQDVTYAGLAPVKKLIMEMSDSLPTTYISSVDEEGYPCTKAMLSPRKREGIKVFYFTTNAFSVRVAHYRANPKSSIYFCDEKNFRAVMLKGTMEVLTDQDSKNMIWREGDTQYYPGGVTDPNYCVLKFTA